LHKEGGSAGRAKIAKYCIMDCELCIHLINLLDMVPNNIGMSNVCLVPFSYIFLRGQGVKVSSIVSQKANELNTRMPTLKNNKNKDDGGFEGAVVLDPKTGIYEEDPIVVLDYASLYPSSIIENNFSHDKLVNDEKYLEYLKNQPAINPELNIQNYSEDKKYNRYDEDIEMIQYDDYRMEKKGETVKKIKTGEKVTCYYIKNKKDEEGNIIPSSQGIVPLVLQSVLDARKMTRKRIKEPGVSESKKKVLDGLQLAYKVTANSVYGQLGARTSDIYKKVIAACTTSVGRQRIDDAENGVKNWARHKGYEEPDIIYGDTDSVFIKFSRKDLNGNTLKGDELLKHCIRCGIEAGEFVDDTLRKPQNLEYEKTFFPFILISKKRYIGDKYEWEKDVDNKNFKRTSMGIVMKRRDNAPIVKYVFGNIIEKIMVDHNFNEALLWLKQTLKDINDGKFPINYFIITKSLRADYKNPKSVAHKVLADRIGERDPGNKPKSNDRIPYAYINITDYDKVFDRKNQYKSGKNKGKDKKLSILQGDRIEHPEYIKKNNLNIDYGFYITNQIMNPIKQVLDLNISSISKNQELFEEFIETDKKLYDKMEKYK
jgi:DNA polymerase delta subunit 1